MKQAILVTGANGGIGSEICSLAKKNSYFVIATDSTASACECDLFIQQDLALLVSDSSQRQIFHEKLKKSLAKMSFAGIVNNAATQHLGPCLDMSEADFTHTLNVNLVSAFSLVKLFAKDLIHASGSVVNISSIHSKLTKPNFVFYATSKAALVGMTKAMAVDFAGKIRVNCISPAAISTKMLQEGFVGQEENLSKLMQYHPSGRIGYPIEIAETVLFLIGEKAKFINGAEIEIQGGIGARLHDPS